jgi:hypothetical protein
MRSQSTVIESNRTVLSYKLPDILTFRHRSFTFNSNKSPTWCNIAEQRRPRVIILFKWINENKLENDNVFLQWNYTQYSRYFEISHIGFKWINQPDATTSQVYYLTFTRMYSSTCFGCPHAHHQELNNCSSSLWFYRWSMVVAVLLVEVEPVITLPR